jgi:hypothetical protein
VKQAVTVRLSQRFLTGSSLMYVAISLSDTAVASTGPLLLAVFLLSSPQAQLRSTSDSRTCGWTSEPNRLHHNSCRQPCELKALGLQLGIPYEIYRDRRS